MSTTTAINGSTPPTASTTPAAAASTTGQTLTQQDFLKIMVAQFTQQDPLSSGDGSSGGSGTSDYVNQLMSMTNLTTMQTMSTQMTTSSGQAALQFAASLPGATVEVSDSNGNTVDGVVQKARASGSDVYLTVGGTEYSSANLLSIDQTAATTAAQATAQAAAAAATPTKS